MSICILYPSIRFEESARRINFCARGNSGALGNPGACGNPGNRDNPRAHGNRGTVAVPMVTLVPVVIFFLNFYDRRRGGAPRVMVPVPPGPGRSGGGHKNH